MISKSRLYSVGGGVVAQFFRDLQKPTRFSGGGVVADFFPCSPGPDHIPLSSVARNHIFTPHRVIFVGRDKHFWLDTPEIRISCWKKKSLKLPKFREILGHFRETWRSGVISGDSRKFRETWQV